MSVTKYDARCVLNRLPLGENTFVHSLPLLLRASATSFATRDSRSDPPGRRSHEPSGSQLCRGRTPAFMRRRPRWVARCSVHVPLSKPPQPRTDAKGAGVPKRKIGFEVLEASAKLRKSSIDCFSAASFEAARRGATEAKGWQLPQGHAQFLVRIAVVNVLTPWKMSLRSYIRVMTKPKPIPRAQI